MQSNQGHNSVMLHSPRNSANQSARISKFNSSQYSQSYKDQQEYQQCYSEASSLFGQYKFPPLIQHIERKIYRKMIAKIITDHIPKNLIHKKVIYSMNQYNSNEFVQYMNQKIKRQIDRFQAWIRLNLVQRQEIVQFKKRILQNQQKKTKKYEKIHELIKKIAEKQKQKKVDEILNKFAQSRKRNYVKFVPNQKLKIENQKIERLLNMQADQSQIEFKKAKNTIKQYQKQLEATTGIKLNKLDALLF